MEEQTATEKKYKKWIIGLSIVIPIAVAALFTVNLNALGFDVKPLSFLPPIYGDRANSRRNSGHYGHFGRVGHKVLLWGPLSTGNTLLARRL